MTIKTFFQDLLLSSVLPSCTLNLSSHKIPPPEEDGKCELISTFSLITQASLGLLCLSCLIIKRFYEHPLRRTWQVWSFDVSKQLIGAMGLHICNICISILKGKSQKKRNPTAGLRNINHTINSWNNLVNIFGKTGNLVNTMENNDDACDWYFLNITFDCTIGVFILYLIFHSLNRILTNKFHVTQIESGQYGPDQRKPSVKAFLKQLTVYFSSLMLTKVVLFYIMELFADQLLWFTSHFLLFWLNDYPDEFEIFIVMFVVPIFMNCLQLILVDNIIQSKWLLVTNDRLNHNDPVETDDISKAITYGTFEQV